MFYLTVILPLTAISISSCCDDSFSCTDRQTWCVWRNSCEWCSVWRNNKTLSSILQFLLVEHRRSIIKIVSELQVGGERDCRLVLEEAGASVWVWVSLSKTVGIARSDPDDWSSPLMSLLSGSSLHHMSYQPQQPTWSREHISYKR